MSVVYFCICFDVHYIQSAMGSRMINHFYLFAQPPFCYNYYKCEMIMNYTCITFYRIFLYNCMHMTSIATRVVLSMNKSFAF